MKRAALEGVRVLDIATVIAAPWAAGIMADFGAEVIKVEMPGRGDTSRGLGPLKDGVSIRWPALGRNKKSITLDFHYEEGKKIFLDLVKQCDVVIENFKTGTLDKWGIGVDVMRKVNPDIIVTHVTGYGQTGPNKNLAGLGMPLQAFSGMTYLRCFRKGGKSISASNSAKKDGSSCCSFFEGTFTDRFFMGRNKLSQKLPLTGLTFSSTCLVSTLNSG